MMSIHRPTHTGVSKFRVYMMCSNACILFPTSINTPTHIYMYFEYSYRGSYSYAYQLVQKISLLHITHLRRTKIVAGAVLCLPDI